MTKYVIVREKISYLKEIKQSNSKFHRFKERQAVLLKWQNYNTDFSQQLSYRSVIQSPMRVIKNSNFIGVLLLFCQMLSASVSS